MGKELLSFLAAADCDESQGHLFMRLFLRAIQRANVAFKEIIRECVEIGTGVVPGGHVKIDSD